MASIPHNPCAVISCDDDEITCVFCGAILVTEIEKINDTCASCFAAQELEDRVENIDRVGDVCRALLEVIPDIVDTLHVTQARNVESLADELRIALQKARQL